MHLVSVGHCQSCSEDTHTQRDTHRHRYRSIHKETHTDAQKLRFVFRLILFYLLQNIFGEISWYFQICFSELCSILFHFIYFFSNFLSMVTIILKFFFGTKIKTILLQIFSFILFSLCSIWCKSRIIKRTLTQYSVV